jgi:hypothetical protein
MASKVFNLSQRRVGRYELLAPLGVGGNGSVYRGRDTATGRPVAVKLLDPELAKDPVICQRFEQEYLVTQQLNDPHIVRSLDFAQENGAPYLVLEYVDGESLAALLKRKGRLGEDEAFDIITQVAGALHRAHEAGFIHRDVTPKNILLSRGVAKLTDFGLVKDLQSAASLTESATGLGTPNYLAPEQLENAKRVDRRCDVYGLAATLYAAITGQIPFSTADESVSPALRPATCAEFIKGLTGVAICEAAPDGGAEDESAAGAERRAAARIGCRLEGLCRPLQGREGDEWQARVRNLSAGGICLLLSRRFEPGALLLVELPAGGAGATRTLVARVIYVVPHVRAGWSIGCRLAQGLNPEELRELLCGGDRDAASGRGGR